MQVSSIRISIKEVQVIGGESKSDGIIVTSEVYLYTF